MDYAADLLVQFHLTSVDKSQLNFARVMQLIVVDVHNNSVLCCTLLDRTEYVPSSRALLNVAIQNDSVDRDPSTSETGNPI